jgi:hypothetical protein
MLPGSRYARVAMIAVTVVIILGLIATAIAYPMSV